MKFMLINLKELLMTNEIYYIKNLTKEDDESWETFHLLKDHLYYFDHYSCEYLQVDWYFISTDPSKTFRILSYE